MIIAQHYPIRLIDRVVEVVHGQYAKTLKNVSINEKVFCGHFPGDPVFPSVYLVEGMGQTCQLMWEQHKSLTAKYDGFLFLQPVMPGDQVVFEATREKEAGDFIFVNAKATVAGVLVAKGKVVAKNLG